MTSEQYSNNIQMMLKGYPEGDLTTPNNIVQMSKQHRRIDKKKKGKK